MDNINRILDGILLPLSKKIEIHTTATPSFVSRIARYINNMLAFWGIIIIKARRDHWNSQQADNKKFVLHFLGHHKEIDIIYSCLADAESKEALDSYLTYRFAYGLLDEETARKHTLLALDVPNLVEKYKGELNQNSLPQLSGLPKTFIDTVLVQTFCAEQYNLSEHDLFTKHAIVIDAGCFLGETAIYFANKLKNNGKIYSFEPISSLAKSAQVNVRANKVEHCVEIINAGLGRQKARKTFSCPESGSSISLKSNTFEDVNIIPLDDFVIDRNITVIDIIKMDIEGAELDALRGATNTIKKFRPVLMICLYHKPADIFDIPNFIKSLNLNYSFYIRAHSDVILFAIPNPL